MKLTCVVLCFFIPFFLISCGYKPSSYYAKKELNGNIFVKLTMDLQDSRNGIIIKDSINELIVHKLNSKIVYDRNLADTIINLKLSSVSMQELQYDKKGYNKLYKAIINIQVNYINKDLNIKKSFSVSGDYDFSIGDKSTITSSKRFEAIKEASSKALDNVISKIAVNSFEKK